MKHFRGISSKYLAQHAEPDRLCRIELECAQINSPQRVGEVLGMVEAEWERLGETKHCLRISIGDRVIRTHR